MNRLPRALPVEGLEETLKAEVIFGDQTMELPLTARFNTPGAYESVFFPMKPGDYTFRIYGTIDGTEIDESFTSWTGDVWRGGGSGATAVPEVT